MTSYADRDSVRSKVECILLDAGISDVSAEATAILDAALHIDSNSDSAQKAIVMAQERANGQPLAFLVGQMRFMGIDLQVASGVLIPREETELLGRSAIDFLMGLDFPQLVAIDMCCGAGNLACALAHHCQTLRMWASDVTESTVALACKNVDCLGLNGRVTVMQGDLFSPLVEIVNEESVDVIVCNPPYISTGKLIREREALLAHEPREAFDGGPYGVSIFQRVVRDALAFLKPGGALMFEVGVGQERQVSTLFDRTKAYQAVSTRNDSEGRPRVVTGIKKGF